MRNCPVGNDESSFISEIMRMSISFTVSISELNNSSHINLFTFTESYKVSKLNLKRFSHSPRDETFSGFIVENHTRFSDRYFQKTHE